MRLTPISRAKKPAATRLARAGRIGKKVFYAPLNGLEAIKRGLDRLPPMGMELALETAGAGTFPFSGSSNKLSLDLQHYVKIQLLNQDVDVRLLLEVVE